VPERQHGDEKDEADDERIDDLQTRRHGLTQQGRHQRKQDGRRKDALGRQVEQRVDAGEARHADHQIGRGEHQHDEQIGPFFGRQLARRDKGDDEEAGPVGKEVPDQEDSHRGGDPTADPDADRLAIDDAGGDPCRDGEHRERAGKDVCDG